MAIAVKYGALDVAKADVDRGVATVTEKLENLDTAVKNAMQHWESAGSEAFHALEQKWAQAAFDLKEILIKIGMHIQLSNDNYMQTDAGVQRMWA